MVDRLDMFGGSESRPIFILVNSFAGWVAMVEREIDDLKYINDLFGVEEEGNRALYYPYNSMYPASRHASSSCEMK